MSEIDYDTWRTQWGTHWGAWLREEMQRRQLRRIDFVRSSPLKDNGRPEVDNTMVGRWLNGAHPTFDKCVIVADMLNLPPLYVVAQAGYSASADEPLRISEGDSEHLILRLEDDQEVRAVRKYLETLREFKRSE